MQLHWLPVCQRINHKLAVITYKTRTTSTPTYLSHLIHDYNPGRCLRSAGKLFLTVPRTSLTLSAKVFTVSVPAVWNYLSFNCRSCKLFMVLLPCVKDRTVWHCLLHLVPAISRLWFTCDTRRYINMFWLIDCSCTVRHIRSAIGYHSNSWASCRAIGREFNIHTGRNNNIYIFIHQIHGSNNNKENNVRTPNVKI